MSKKQFRTIMAELQPIADRHGLDLDLRHPTAMNDHPKIVVTHVASGAQRDLMLCTTPRSDDRSQANFSRQALNRMITAQGWSPVPDKPKVVQPPAPINPVRLAPHNGPASDRPAASSADPDRHLRMLRQAYPEYDFWNARKGDIGFSLKEKWGGSMAEYFEIPPEPASTLQVRVANCLQRSEIGLAQYQQKPPTPTAPVTTTKDNQAMANRAAKIFLTFSQKTKVAALLAERITNHGDGTCSYTDPAETDRTIAEEATTLIGVPVNKSHVAGLRQELFGVTRRLLSNRPASQDADAAFADRILRLEKAFCTLVDKLGENSGSLCDEDLLTLMAEGH